MDRGLCRRTFTLIELLVVISVISILFAFVVPALQQARLKSQGMAGNDQLRQMGMGHNLYADDSNEYFFPSPNEYPSAAQESPYMYKRNPDLTEVAVEYDFVGLTKHPVLQSPAWNDSGNNENVLYSPWCYYPNYLLALKESEKMSPRPSYPTGPPTISRGTDKHALMSEIVLDDKYFGSPRAVHVEDGKRQAGDPGFLGVNYENSSHVFMQAPSLAHVKGTYVIYYDGHADWVDAPDLERIEIENIMGGFPYSMKQEGVHYPHQPAW